MDETASTTKRSHYLAEGDIDAVVDLFKRVRSRFFSREALSTHLYLAIVEGDPRRQTVKLEIQPRPNAPAITLEDDERKVADDLWRFREYVDGVRDGLRK